MSSRRTPPPILLSALVLLAGCGAHRTPPEPIEPGTYSFTGTGRHVDRSGSRVDEHVVVVMGRVELLPSGALLVSGTSGSCTVPGAVPAMRITVNCNDTTLRMTASSGTAEVVTTIFVERLAGCRRYEVGPDGRSTGVCAEREVEHRPQRVRVQVPLVVTRLRDSRD